MMIFAQLGWKVLKILVKDQKHGKDFNIRRLHTNHLSNLAFYNVLFAGKI